MLRKAANAAGYQDEANASTRVGKFKLDTPEGMAKFEKAAQEVIKKYNLPINYYLWE